MVNAAVSALPGISLIVAVAGTSKPKFPSPVMLLTVTSIVVPVAAETEAILPLTVPVLFRVKSPISKFLTGSLKLTV